MLWPPAFPTLGLRAQGTAESWAILSEDDVYRYALGRMWNALLPVVLWLLHNPSKATHEVTDTTLTRVVRFSRLWGFGRCVILNPFAYRATDPHELPLAADPVGPLNDEVLRGLLAPHPEAPRLVAGWGKVAKALQPRIPQVVAAVARTGRPMHCLGLNGDGSPRHPLRIAYTTPVVPVHEATRNLAQGHRYGLVRSSSGAAT